MIQKKWIAVLGTRPEAIKLAPLLLEAKQFNAINVKTCTSGQHQTICQNTLLYFGLKTDLHCPPYTGQNLIELHLHCFQHLSSLFKAEKPEGIIVQGDTSTAYTAALAAFYLKIPIAHIEAGLRTYDNQNPFPEEFHRKSISQLATWHFCPTLQNKKNLSAEGIQTSSYVVGNTVIDACIWMTKQSYPIENPSIAEIILKQKPFLFASFHRRENWQFLEKFCRELIDLAQKFTVIFTLHPNPQLQQKICRLLKENPKIILVQPLPYSDCLHALKSARLVISDSGGFQEECSFFRTPLIIYRKSTERPETLLSNTEILKPDTDQLSQVFQKVINTKQKTSIECPFGDGTASKQICNILFQNKIGNN